MDKLLITGGSGFLGSLIREQIKTKSITVGRNEKSDIICDLSSSIPLIPDIDVVLHIAGMAHIIPKNESEKKSFFDVNVRGTENLLIGLSNAANLPKSFVFISSVAVYGKESGNLIDEKHPLLAKDPYGQSKIQAEKIIQDWCNRNGVICCILRLPLLVGPNPRGNLKTMIDGILNGYYVNIGNGGAKKSAVLAKDVASIIVPAASIGGIYNLTDGYHPSFLELSKLIAAQLNKSKPTSIPVWLVRIMAYIGDVFGSKAPINTLKFKKITTNLTFDDRLARKHLGWNPMPVLQDLFITEL